jgi:hypothetical protein
MAGLLVVSGKISDANDPVDLRRQGIAGAIAAPA